MIPPLTCSEADLTWSFIVPDLNPETEKEFTVSYEPKNDLQKLFSYDSKQSRVTLKIETIDGILESGLC